MNFTFNWMNILSVGKKNKKTVNASLAVIFGMRIGFDYFKLMNFRLAQNIRIKVKADL